MNDALIDEKAVFNTARQIGDPAARDDYLNVSCRGDADALQRIKDLLRVHHEAQSFLESPAAAFAPTVTEPALKEGPGTVIGPYKLLEQIGEGGFGVVFMAEQTQPVRRKVALKVLKPGMDTRQVVARFEAERQALAIMDHPNIARVFDGGATASGRPFFVMELVKGVPITEHCDQNHLTPRARLELFVSVCQAVQHAHQKGIIHRDLKPSNVLVTMQDTAPLVKVIDFGVAKALGQELTDKTLFTGFAQMIGSPLYMSPEQAGQSSLDVDTRSDIYSLGVLLYELLTGTTPFDKQRLRDATYDEIRRIVREEDPPRPSTRLSDLGKNGPHAPLRAGESGTRKAPTGERSSLASIAAQRHIEPAKLPKLVRGELDWIVMKALEKDRSRRYETANGFALDVQRYLADEPVAACPPSAAYRLRKFARRHRGPVLAVSLVALALAGGIVGTTWGMFRATSAEGRAVGEAQQKEQERATAVRERERATEAEHDARRRLYEAKLATAKAIRWSRQVGQRFESWQAVTEAADLAREMGLGAEHLAEVRDEAVACLAPLADVRVVREWEGFPAGSSGLAFDGELEVYARLDKKGNVSVRSVADDRELAVLPGEVPGDAHTRFSPACDLLAVRCRQQLPGRSTNFQVWDWRHGKCVFEPSFVVHWDALAFSPDGRHLYLGQADGTLTIHDVRTWSEQKRTSVGLEPEILAFHPGGTRLAIADHVAREVQVRDAGTGDLLYKWTAPAGVFSVAWHPGGDLLAVGCMDFRVYLCDSTTGAQRAVLQGHQDVVEGVQFAPSGDTLISAAWDGTSRLWDPWTGRELIRFAGSNNHFSRDGHRLITWAGSKLTLMEMASGRECRTLPRSRFTPGERIGYGALSPDGRWLAFGTTSGVRLWDLVLGKEGAFLPVSETHAAQFHPAGKELFTAGPSGLFRWPFNLDAGSLQIGPARKVSPDRLGRISQDRDGRVLAVVALGGCRVLDLEDLTADARSLPHGAADSVVISPNGRWVAAGTHGGFGVKVWDARSGELIHHLLPGERTSIVSVSPDSQWLVIGTSARFELWETDSWQLRRHITRESGHQNAGLSAFSADGKVLAIAISPSAVQLINTATWRPLARLQPSDSDMIDSLAFSPDGDQLAVSTRAGAIRLWDLRLIRERLQVIGLDWDLPRYPPAPSPGNAQPVQVEVDLGEFPGVTAAQEHFARARAHVDANRQSEALAEYSKGLELDPTDARALNNLSWYLVTCPNLQLHDAARAVTLAQKAVELAPNNVIYWNTLGVARYRAGDWKTAIDALEKAEHAEPDRNLGFNAFFLAMAHWELGGSEGSDQASGVKYQEPTAEQRLKHQEQARQWFDQATRWMEKNRRQDEELKRFRAEAAELLGVHEKKD